MPGKVVPGPGLVPAVAIELLRRRVEQLEVQMRGALSLAEEARLQAHEGASRADDALGQVAALAGRLDDLEEGLEDG